MDGGCTFAGVCRQSDPVAGDRMARLPSLVAQASGELGAQVTDIRGHQIRFALLDDDTPGEVAGARMRLKCQAQRIGPAILFDQKRHSHIEWAL